MASNGSEPAGHRVRLYRDGSGQVLHIPRDLEFDSAEAIVRREGDRIVIEPAGPPERRKTLTEVLAELEPIDEKLDFAEFDEIPSVSG